MNQRDYLRLRQKIEDEYQAKLKALETVWELAQGPVKAPRIIVPNDKEESPVANSIEKDVIFEEEDKLKRTDKVADETPESPTINNLLMSVIPWNAAFTISDLNNSINEQYNLELGRFTLYPIVRDMVKQKQLKIIEKGKGQRPTIYKRGENF
jgi:hypothetical protein